jgi:Tfp pilus assembly protein PilN
MERFGGSAAGDLKIYVLADGSAVEQITEYLSAAGLNAQTAMVEMAKLKSNTSLCRKEIYEYLVAIGLALMELDEDGRELDLFERLRAAGEEKQKKRRVPSLKLSAAIVLIMLAAFTLVSYGIDVARLRKIETALGKVEADIDINQLEKEHQLKKVVARQRADVLELLSLINTCRPEELMLDSVSFNKKQPVAVTGHTKDKAKIYEFRKNLQKQADIKTVRPQSSAASDKKEDISFTITFIYKNFGKK